ncbi:MAG: vWA domain-containing protein [Candidatus Electrothrix sp. YB6]
MISIIKTISFGVALAVFAAAGNSLAAAAPPEVSKTAVPDDLCAGEETTITLTVTGAGEEFSETVPMDVVFALDSSGSMDWNDPSDKRKEAAKDFVDKMDDSIDQAGVVSWDSNVDFTQPLTNDFLLVRDKIDDVDSSGNTNLNAGLNAAISLLDSGKQANATHVIIFLTDGDGAYTPSGSPGSPADAAAAKGYIIYSIGLGNADAGPLQDMANATGGQFFSAPTADNLQSIFDAIFDELIINTVPHNVNVEEVVQGHMLVDQGSFNIAPDSIFIDPVNQRTTIVWNNIGINDADADLSADETVTLSFNATSNQSGNNLGVDVMGAAQVHYTDAEGENPGAVDIPQAYIDVNAPPQVMGAHASIECLWPPNHKFTDISIEGITDPDGDEVGVEITSITSDEPVDAQGSGGKNHAPDAYGVGTDTAGIRAERMGPGNGRVYEISFTASDDRGCTSEGSVRVVVPHDQHDGCDSPDDGQLYDATAAQ